MPASGRPPWAVGRWAVWGLPHRLLGSVLVVEAFAALLLGMGVLATPIAAFAAHAPSVALLALFGVVHTEIALRIERVRRRVTETAHVSFSSVWTFAAALLFPPLVASMFAIVLLTYLYLRVWRPAKVPPYREAFTAATVVLAVHAAAGTTSYVGATTGGIGSALGLVVVVAALLAYTVVNTCLVVGAVVISSDRGVKQVLGHGDELVLELATLSMGALVALGVMACGPVLAIFALPPVLVLHRAVLVRQLERAANTDGKTGLLTAAAWQHKATQLIEKAGDRPGAAALLIMDLDHFKRVNDRHGHLAGDVVLAAVGASVRAEVREQDLVGRFGGEEFVVLLAPPDGDRHVYPELRAVADRIRRRVEQLAVELPTPDGSLTIRGLSLSVGGALFPEDGRDLLGLISVADSALYAAKREGRNTVRLGPHRTAFEARPAERDARYEAH